MNKLDAIDRKLLNNFQARFPLVEKPYAFTANLMGLSEDDVFKRIQRLHKLGIIRSIGHSPEPRSFGYVHILCAAEVRTDYIDSVVSYIKDIPEVTQIIKRKAAFNMWFTIVTDRSERINKILDGIKTQEGVWDLANFAADHYFKVNSFFDFSPNRDSRNFMPQEAWENEISRYFNFNSKNKTLTDHEYDILKVLSKGIPISKTPFKDLEKTLNMSSKEIISFIQDAYDNGVIRKFGTFIGHKQAGFIANTLVVWEVSEDEIIEIGKRIARYSCVTRCYARPGIERWQYQIYTNIQGRFEEEILRYVNRIAYLERIQSWRILYSEKEYKNTTPYFLRIDPLVIDS